MQDFAVEVIYDVQQPERPSIPKTVCHEVHAPNGIRLIRFEKRLFNTYRKPLLSSPADVKPQGCIYSVHPFMVPQMAHAAYPEVALPEPDGRISLHQILQQHNQRLILTLFLLITLGTGTDLYSLTCLTMANPMLSDHVVNQAALLIKR